MGLTAQYRRSSPPARSVKAGVPEAALAQLPAQDMPGGRLITYVICREGSGTGCPAVLVDLPWKGEYGSPEHWDWLARASEALTGDTRSDRYAPLLRATRRQAVVVDQLVWELREIAVLVIRRLLRFTTKRTGIAFSVLGASRLDR